MATKAEAPEITRDYIAENHSAIVMDNTIGSTNVEDTIFWYRAELDPGQFKMGKQVYWRLAEQYTKTVREQDEEEAERVELERMENAPRRRISMVQCEDEEGKVLRDHQSHMLHL